MAKIIKLILSIVICEGVGIIAGIATRESVNTWYQLLNKPSFTPPNYLFAPVWIVLYFLMGISLFLIWKDGLDSKIKKFAFFFFLFHLFINGIWSFFFFKWQLLFYSFLVISFLWILIIITIILFYKVNKISAFLLIPYLLWVSYASILNYTIWRIN